TIVIPVAHGDSHSIYGYVQTDRVGHVMEAPRAVVSIQGHGGRWGLGVGGSDRPWERPAPERLNVGPRLAVVQQVFLPASIVVVGCPLLALHRARGLSVPPGRRAGAGGGRPGRFAWRCRPLAAPGR